jgi:rubrerythrin
MMSNHAIQTEIDASYLYQKLAENESDELIAHVYAQMSAIEKSHAEAFALKENINLESIFKPSWRAKTLNTIGKIFGYDYVLGTLMDTEKSISNAVIKTKKEHKLEQIGRASCRERVYASV